MTDAGRVGLVIVSHSARLADGVVELAGQMAPGVPLIAAGGMADGGLGTDAAKVADALARADAGSGVVLLFDLGSAQLTAELVVEMLDDPSSVLVVDAPLVEGAVAAAVAAQGGGSLTAVAKAAADAAAPPAGVTEPAGAAEQSGVTVASAPTAAPESVPHAQSGPAARADIVLGNDIGLHARPAAQLARSLTGLTADVTVRFGDRAADARSVLALLGLTARQGDRLTVSATGPDAEEAVRRIERLADDNFGE